MIHIIAGNICQIIKPINKFNFKFKLEIYTMYEYKH